MVSISHALRQVKDDLPRLIEAHVHEALDQLPGFLWRDRLLNPLVTLVLFITQVMHGNTAITQLCRDTLTLIRSMEPLWNARPPGALLKVGIVLTHLVPEGSATLPLYADQAHLDVLADYMDELDRKYGQHTIYLGGMWGAKDTAPTRISFTQIPEMEEFFYE